MYAVKSSCSKRLLCFWGGCDLTRQQLQSPSYLPELYQTHTHIRWVLGDKLLVAAKSRPTHQEDRTWLRSKCELLPTYFPFSQTSFFFILVCSFGFSLYQCNLKITKCDLIFCFEFVVSYAIHNALAHTAVFKSFLWTF